MSNIGYNFTGLEKNERNSGGFLIVSNLCKSFGKTKAVNNLSFEVKPGEIYGLLGPNGAGKSTTIKSILGLLEVDSGSISVFGHSPSKSPSKVKELIGYVPEEFALYEFRVFSTTSYGESGIKTTLKN